MKKFTKGFTLIELLVVIAIIGILASIVLASLSTATSKGNDAKIQEQISSIRDAAQIYYASNASYGTTQTVCTAGMFADTASGMSNLVTAANYPGGTAPTCSATSAGYVVYHPLSSNSNLASCVDYTGAASTTATLALLSTGKNCQGVTDSNI